MKPLILACLALIVLVSPVLAAEQTITFKSGDETATGFLVTPEGKGPFPAVIVIHEWWGLDGWVKDQARALAREGYVALAPDLYRGKVTDKQEEAHQLMMGTPRDRALRDLKAAFGTLASRSDVRKDRIGMIGWCMGGMYALADWPRSWPTTARRPPTPPPSRRSRPPSSATTARRTRAPPPSR